jgi:hypothetical protein
MSFQSVPGENERRKLNMQAIEKTADRKARKRKNANRDQEIVVGFDRYHKVAYTRGKRYYANWFPSREDLFQATALAVAEVMAEFGEQSELK